MPLFQKVLEAEHFLKSEKGEENKKANIRSDRCQNLYHVIRGASLALSILVANARRETQSLV